MLITGLFSTKKISNADIKSIEVQTFGTKKSMSLCRMAVNGRFPLTFMPEMFEDKDDYHTLVKCLSRIEKKYSQHSELGLKGVVSGYCEQLVTYSAVLIMVTLNTALFFMSQDDYLLAMDNFAFSKNVIESREYYRFVTAFFLHVDPVHLFINLISLGVLGGMLERFFGRARYFNILILSTLSGWFFSLIFSQYNLVVGASGGVFGLFGAYLVLKVVSKGSLQPSVDPMPYWWIALLLIFQVVSDLYINDTDFAAHIGGMIGGAICLVLSIFTFKKSVSLEKLVSLVLLLSCFFAFSNFMR